LRARGSDLEFVREMQVRDGLSVLVFGNANQNTAVVWSHHGSVPVAFHLGDMKEIESVTLMDSRLSPFLTVATRTSRY
jgi:hypothetical protein